MFAAVSEKPPYLVDPMRRVHDRLLGDDGAYDLETRARRFNGRPRFGVVDLVAIAGVTPSALARVAC